MNKLLTTFLTLLIAQTIFAQTKSENTAASNQTASNAVSRTIESCGCELSVPEVLAVVNGIKLTFEDVNTPKNKLAQQTADLQKQIVEARKREFELQINSKLLEAEAKRRNTPATKLLEKEVIAKVPPVTDAEAQTFYETNKSRIEGDFNTVKNDIIIYLRDQRHREEASRFAARLRAAAHVKIHVNSIAPPKTSADRDRVLAEVNGEKITSGNIEDNLRPLIYEVQGQIYNLHKATLESRINDMLLEHEAVKRKMTVRALLDAEVASKVQKVSEAEAQTFYNQNKERINGEFPQVKDQVISYLQTQDERKVMVNFAGRLWQAAGVQTFLMPPELPAYNVSIEDQPMKGNPAAKVTIVEFFDFQCPSCAQLQPVIDKLMNEYGDRVRLVMRDFPLSQHNEAFKAAEAAEAAREQGKYWEYIALLLKNQKTLGIPKLKEYASQLSLDRAKFDKALDTGKYAEKIQRDLQDGERLGVNGTPTLFVNGKRVEDRTFEALKAAVETAIAIAERR
jgi:protein-disulfide isomerase